MHRVSFYSPGIGCQALPDTRAFSCPKPILCATMYPSGLKARTRAEHVDYFVRVVLGTSVLLHGGRTYAERDL